MSYREATLNSQVLPPWANWMAITEAGTIVLFRDKPRYRPRAGIWMPDGIVREYCAYGKTNPPKHPEDTLEALNNHPAETSANEYSLL